MKTTKCLHALMLFIKCTVGTLVLLAEKLNEKNEFVQISCTKTFTFTDTTGLVSFQRPSDPIENSSFPCFCLLYTKNGDPWPENGKLVFQRHSDGTSYGDKAGWTILVTFNQLIVEASDYNAVQFEFEWTGQNPSISVLNTQPVTLSYMYETRTYNFTRENVLLDLSCSPRSYEDAASSKIVPTTLSIEFQTTSLNKLVTSGSPSSTIYKSDTNSWLGTYVIVGIAIAGTVVLLTLVVVIVVLIRRRKIVCFGNEQCTKRLNRYPTLSEPNPIDNSAVSETNPIDNSAHDTAVSYLNTRQTNAEVMNVEYAQVDVSLLIKNPAENRNQNATDLKVGDEAPALTYADLDFDDKAKHNAQHLPGQPEIDDISGMYANKPLDDITVDIDSPPATSVTTDISELYAKPIKKPKLI